MLKLLSCTGSCVVEVMNSLGKDGTDIAWKGSMDALHDLTLFPAGAATVSRLATPLLLPLLVRDKLSCQMSED
tara:strand:+ start:643 stop:861 length:219 start_codon:yes stop_codon:yes gene_type:complete